MKVTLNVAAGPHRGERFVFEEHDAFLVGRSSEAQFRLPIKDKSLSRVHFMVEVNPPSCRLMDMASTNGTFVNGDKVRTIDLKDGDQIKAGDTVIAVAIEPEDPGSPTTIWPRSDDSTATAFTLPKYRMVRELGRGGMGVVWLAHAEADGAPIAVKTIVPAAAGSPGAVERFLREASLLRRIDHPNVVRFREVGFLSGQIYFAMDYVRGTNAVELLRKHGPLPVPVASGLACQALDALEYAHGLGIVHRDIKPENLLVEKVEGRSRVKVADFGLARIYHSSTLSGLSVLNQAGGTVGYMPPEQVTNFREAKPPADLYALGATLYVLLTGKKIFDFPPRTDEQLMKILREDPVPIRDRRPDVPDALAAVVHRSLAKKPEERWAEAGAFRAALAPFTRPR